LYDARSLFSDCTQELIFRTAVWGAREPGPGDLCGCLARLPRAPALRRR